MRATYIKFLDYVLSFLATLIHVLVSQLRIVGCICVGHGQSEQATTLTKKLADDIRAKLRGGHTISSIMIAL